MCLNICRLFIKNATNFILQEIIEKKIEEYSAEIEEYGNAILDVCKEIITKNLLSKKHTKSVEKIFNQTKELMSTTN